MSSSCAYIRFSAILILSLVSILATSAAGQVPSDINKVPFANADDRDKAVAKAQTPKVVVADAKPVVESTPDPNDLQSEVDSMKAENAAVREMLRKMEEQQKVLLEQVERLSETLLAEFVEVVTTLQIRSVRLEILRRRNNLTLCSDELNLQRFDD